MSVNKIVSVAKAFFSWLGPFGLAVCGIAVMLFGFSADKPVIALSAFGGLMILSAMDMKAEQAKARETERWAELFANMIQDEKRVEIRVNHEWESMRPHLDARISELVTEAVALANQKGQDHE